MGDITFLRVATGWRYLAIVMDQFSRRILGWTLTQRRTSAVTCQALNKAAALRPTRRVIFHSDRGSEYMGAAFGARLAELGVRQIANVRGPGDHAHAESFFHSLKAELTRGRALSHRSPPARAPHTLHHLLQYDPLTFWARVPVAHCL